MTERDPLDEILEAAGIPAEAPQRILRQRDGYNVVGPSFISHDQGALQTGITAPATPKKGLMELISGWKIEPDAVETLRQHVGGTGTVTINGETYQTNQITVTCEPYGVY